MDFASWSPASTLLSPNSSAPAHNATMAASARVVSSPREILWALRERCMRFELGVGVLAEHRDGTCGLAAEQRPATLDEETAGLGLPRRHVERGTLELVTECRAPGQSL